MGRIADNQQTKVVAAPPQAAAPLLVGDAALLARHPGRFFMGRTVDGDDYSEATGNNLR